MLTSTNTVGTDNGCIPRFIHVNWHSNWKQVSFWSREISAWP